MQTLPQALQPFANYKQFVIWQAIPNKKNPNKFDKITLNPNTLFNHNAHDPAIWFSAENALSMLNNLGGEPFGVGFVFTDNDPFWFFDIDGCVDDSGNWTNDARSYCDYFAGCAIEISHSARGLHIFGTGEFDSNHTKKNIPLGLEFYHKDRFVALTGNGAIGDAFHNPENKITEFVKYYFPPKQVTNNINWTTEPDPNSRPLKTNKALIKKMCDTTSAGSVFGAKVTARDLWECNDEKLAVAYPSYNDSDPFDRSSADQALCNHLAFWTGKDCDRIELLMGESGLLRDKWQDREQYRRDTILNAVNACKEVYGSQIAKKENASVDWKPDQMIATNGSEILANGGSQMVAYEDRPTFFNNHYFLTSNSNVFCPDGVVRGQTAYNAMYSTVEFLEAFGGKPIKEAWKAYVTATDVTRAEVFDRSYRPEYDYLTVFNDGGRRWVNEYVNRDGERVQGDATPFYNHIKLMLPCDNDAEILISWMAAFIQNAGKKFFWSPFIQGVEGNGKSLITRVLSYCIGTEHVEDIDPEDFCNSGGKFNAYIRNHRLGVLEEIKTGSRNQAENTLKRFIGNSRIQVQKKGVDQETIPTCINFILMSNYKDAIKVTDHTRRFAILFTDQQEVSDLVKQGMQKGGSYFKNLFDWFHNDNGWGKTANFLANYQIRDEFNPATLADKAPVTSSFLEAITESKSAPHQAVIEAMSSGKTGTLKGWLSVQALRMILQSDYGLKAPSGKMLAQYLKQEGYIKHPALTNNGRATRAIIQEGNNRSVLYVRADSVQAQLLGANNVTDHYQKAQGYINELPSSKTNQLNHNNPLTTIQ